MALLMLFVIPYLLIKSTKWKVDQEMGLVFPCKTDVLMASQDFNSISVHMVTIIPFYSCSTIIIGLHCD